MENKSPNTSLTPKRITFKLLSDITNDFSEEHKVGGGGFGDVYKGVLDDGSEIAIKKLHPTVGLDDDQFSKEFDNLMRVQHKNIIRLVGYCYEIKKQHIKIKANYVLAEMHERALCFEYLQHGSLDKHLSDESPGFDWHTRYKIITGTCEGLDYLHNGSNDRIYHLDLKPANILLDENYMPKITDFGLSRLFPATQTQTTKNIIGTRPYMPPEYIQRGQISKKFDVFSLGVTIIEIMAGPFVSSGYGDMSNQEFIESVQEKWKKRLQGTSRNTTSLEADSLEVKTCIEIAVSCVETSGDNRPTIREVINKLNEMESLRETLTGQSSDCKLERLVIAPFLVQRSGEEEADEVRITMIGPWGGKAGKAHSIKGASHHHRVESVTIWISADVVDAFAFSYSAPNRKKHNVGPWGGPGGSPHRIYFGPSEFLLEVSGTTGPYVYAVADAVKSLKLVTNAGSYGPFGSGGGTSFKTSMQNDGSIVGFFGHAGTFVHAIGVYMSPIPPTISVSRHVQRDMGGNLKLEAIEVLSKVGPWGGNYGGKPQDIKVLPHRMESMTVCSDVAVNSLSFSYNDRSGKQHILGPWGGPRGSSFTIRLGDFEHLNGITGTFGPHNDANGSVIMTSLTFTTNHQRYGPFGQGGGTEFTIPVEIDGSIVGFFGRAGYYLDALGVYIRRNSVHAVDVNTITVRRRAMECARREEASSEQETIIEEGDIEVDNNALSKVGHWGGNWGKPYDMKVVPHRIESITICSDSAINSLAFSYNDCNGEQQISGPWGGPGGNSFTIRLGAFDHLKGISGTFGPFQDAQGNVIITSLTFTTNHRRYGPFGRGGGTMFTVPVEIHGSIVGFFGRAGYYLDALGVYIRTY